MAAASRKTREQRASSSEETICEIITRFETAAWGFSGAGAAHDACSAGYARQLAIGAADELRAALRTCLRLAAFKEHILKGPNLDHPEHDDAPCVMQTEPIRYAVGSCITEIRECSLLPSVARENLCAFLDELTADYAGANPHAAYAILAQASAIIEYLKSQKAR